MRRAGCCSTPPRNLRRRFILRFGSFVSSSRRSRKAGLPSAELLQGQTLRPTIGTRGTLDAVRACWLLEETNCCSRCCGPLARPVRPCFQQRRWLDTTRNDLTIAPTRLYSLVSRKAPWRVAFLYRRGLPTKVRGPSDVDSSVRGALAGRSRARFFPCGDWVPTSKACYQALSIFPWVSLLRAMLYEIP